MKQERDIQNLYEGLQQEDIEFLQRDDGGDDLEAPNLDVPVELPGVSSEGTQEETRHVQQKKEEDK